MDNIVNAAKADLEEMKIKIKDFEATKFNSETSTAEASQRYARHSVLQIPPSPCLLKFINIF